MALDFTETGMDCRDHRSEKGNYIFWSEVGSGFGLNPTTHPHQKFRGLPIRGVQTANIEHLDSLTMGGI